MAELFECETCGKDVAENAVTRPHCGQEFGDGETKHEYNARVAFIFY